MQVIIEIENCRDCPFGWSHTNHVGEVTVVCDKLQDNVGAGDTVSDRCPLVVETEGMG